MKAWLQANWKWLLAAVGAFVIVILLYLRTRGSSSSQPAPVSTVTFPDNPVAGATAAAAAAVQSAAGQVTLQGRTGYRTNAQGTPLLSVWKTPGLSGGELTELPAGTQLASAGVPVSGEVWSGSSFWQPVVLPDGTNGFVWAPDTSATLAVGQGGPGTLDNLRQAALGLQTRSHRLGLSSRAAGRLRADATQASREASRVLAESRGAAPVGGPLPSSLRRGRR